MCWVIYGRGGGGAGGGGGGVIGVPEHACATVPLIHPATEARLLIVLEGLC